MIALVLPLLWAGLTVPLPSFGSNPEPADVAFVALGNAGTGSPGQAALRDQLVRRAGDYDLALFLGDNADPGSTRSDYALNLFGVYGPVFQAQGQPPPAPRRTIPKPAYAVAGDHEVARDRTADGMVGSFVNPLNGPKGVPPERFYSFDVGPVHFVALDSPILLDPATPPSVQDAIRSWLIADLDLHLAQVTVVFDHHPFFGSSVGPVGQGSGTSAGALGATWFPLLAAHGVDLVLSGHDPSYQRNVPMTGVTSYVVGSSGAAPQSMPPAPYTARELGELTYLSVEVRGCAITTRAVLEDGSTFDPWTFSAPTCTTGPRGGERFADGFETGDFSAWSTVQVGTGASAGVDRAAAHDGSYGARFTAHGEDAYAYARRQLPTPETDLAVVGDLRVVEEGPSGGNVPLIRLFDDRGQRVLSLYRQNLAASKLYMSHGDDYDTTTGVLPLGTWGHVVVRVRVSGVSAAIDVSLNGARIYSTTAVAFDATGIVRVQVGNDTPGQPFGIQVDNVAVLDGPSSDEILGARPSSGPGGATAVPPTVEPSASAPGPTTSPSGSPRTLLDDGFDGRGLRSWTIVAAGDGRVELDRSRATHGLVSAHLVGGWTSGSSIAIRQSLPSPSSTLTVGADVLVAREGPAGANVPLIRLLDETGGRLVSVLRQNANADRVYVMFGGVTYRTTGLLPVGRWSTVRLSIHDNGTTTWVQVSLDGQVVFSGSSPIIAGRGAAVIQLGNETKSQPLDLFVDQTIAQEP